MTTTPRGKKTKGGHGFKTPAKAKDDVSESEKFSLYGLPPPSKTITGGCSFDRSERNIKEEFQKQWETEPVQTIVVTDEMTDSEKEMITEKNKKIEKGNEALRQTKRILVFLYSRGFERCSNKQRRKYRIHELLELGIVRNRMLQILETEGDTDKSETHWKHYVKICLVIGRYFDQEGARGFVEDMSSVKYYLRNQKKHASCFLQAPCVFTSYLLQTHGLDVPPIDGSRLIRHEFTSDQLHAYAVINRGGDSKSIFQIIEKQFFDCTFEQRPLNSYESHTLVDEKEAAVVKKYLREGPGLVSKFMIPDNFSLEREAGGKLGFGIARFTEWNKVGEWFPLGGDATIEEKVRAGRWKALCCAEHPVMDVGSFDDLTLATTASTRSSASEMASYSSPESQDSNEESSEDASEESSEESDEESVDDQVEGLGEAEAVEAQLHALILLGVKEENGEDFWVLQNSWSNNMRIIEMSTSYLSESGATITFADKKIYEPRKQTRKQIACCSSPVAESALFERADCENWDDALVNPDIPVDASFGM